MVSGHQKDQDVIGSLELPKSSPILGEREGTGDLIIYGAYVTEPRENACSLMFGGLRVGDTWRCRKGGTSGEDTEAPQLFPTLCPVFLFIRLFTSILCSILYNELINVCKRLPEFSE